MIKSFINGLCRGAGTTVGFAVGMATLYFVGCISDELEKRKKKDTDKSDYDRLNEELES